MRYGFGWSPGHEGPFAKLLAEKSLLISNLEGKYCGVKAECHRSWIILDHRS